MQYKYTAMQFAAMQYKLCKCALQRKLCWQREAACPASEACDHRDHLLHHLQWPTDDAAGDGEDHDDHKTIVLIEELTMMMGIEILVWDFKQEPTS